MTPPTKTLPPQSRIEQSPADGTGRPAPDERAGRTGGVDPRIVARRDDVRRTERRRRLRLALLSITVVAVGALCWGAVRSPIFRVRHIKINGNAHTPTRTLLRAAGLNGHPLLVDIDPGRIARNVVSLPWVDRVSVHRHWPASLELTVVERSPSAVASDRLGGWALLDATGRVLAVAADAPKDLPTVALAPPPTTPPVTADQQGETGRSASSSAPGASPPAAPPGPEPGPLSAAGIVEEATAGAPGTSVGKGLGSALGVAVALPATLRARIGRVVADAAGDVQLELRPTGRVEVGPPTELAEKFVALETLLDRVKTGGRIIDVRVPAAPVLTAA